MDVIAHSMGGLATRYLAASSPSAAQEIHTLIEVGTPSLGSPLAEKLVAYQNNTPRLSSAVAWFKTTGTLTSLMTSKEMNISNGGVSSLVASYIAKSSISNGYSPVGARPKVVVQDC